jgi:hypothetical protein
MHKSGARLIASGCMTAALVDEIAGDWPAGLRAKSGRR